MIWTKGTNQSAKFQTFDCSLEGSPNLYLDRLLLLKVYKMLAKKHRGIMSHDTEDWCRIQRKTDFWFQKWQEFGEFWPDHSKFSKFLLLSFFIGPPSGRNAVIKMSTLIGSFCSKYITFDLKKRREVIFHDSYGFENDMKNMANFQCTWKISKLGLWWDPGVQSRKCMSLKFTEVLCVMTMKNDDKFEEELTCRFKIDMKNLTNFDPSTKKSQKSLEDPSTKKSPFEQSI